MKYYLSIDSGGTKTAFLLIDENGQKLINFSLGPANYLVNGLDNVIKVYKEGIKRILEETNIEEKDISQAFIAMAGFGDIPDDIQMINNKIKSELNFKLVIGNDTENALSGSLMGESGIHIIAGTGSIGLGKDLNGKLYRSGGWHHSFGGDEGSGYWIGCRLLQHFTKQADGREDKTYLYDYIMRKYELDNSESILDLVVNKWNFQRDKIASMSKDVYECARKCDYIAYSIFTEAAKELALIVNAIYANGVYDSEVKVSYSGGVFNSLEYFESTFINSLSFKNKLVSPKFGPLVGGVILALKQDNVTIDDKLINNLKMI